MTEYIPVEDILIEPHRGMEHTVILTFRGRSFQFNDCEDWFKIATCRGPTFLSCDSILRAINLVYAIALLPTERIPPTLNNNDVKLQNPDSPSVQRYEAAKEIRKCGEEE